MGHHACASRRDCVVRSLHFSSETEFTSKTLAPARLVDIKAAISLANARVYLFNRLQVLVKQLGTLDKTVKFNSAGSCAFKLLSATSTAPKCCSMATLSMANTSAFCSGVSVVFLFNLIVLSCAAHYHKLHKQLAHLPTNIYRLEKS